MTPATLARPGAVADHDRSVIDMPERTCIFDGCRNPRIRARGWCSTHYERWRTLGDPALTHRSLRPSAEQRFWVKVQKPDEGDGCWLWSAACDRDGYGVFSPTRRHQVRAHRYAYELAVGPVGADLVLDHLCRIRNCVNPLHLEPVTVAENNRRSGWARRRGE